MKVISTIVYLCLATLLGATDTKEKPAFPDAVISIEGPHGDKWSTSLPEILPEAFRADRGAQIELSHFQGTMDCVSWRHVASTEAGDIYLVYYTSPDGKKKEASSLLFDGKSEVSWRHADWRISIHARMKKPNKAPEPTAPSGRVSS